MTSFRPARLVLHLGLLVTLGACSTAKSSSFPDDSAARPGRDVPDRFEPSGSGRVTSRPAHVDTTCFNPVTDPRDGTPLTLLRSHSGRGDYRVPPERYGVEPGELLRLDCATGRVIGIVRE